MGLGRAPHLSNCEGCNQTFHICEFGLGRGFGENGGNSYNGSSGGNWRFRKLDLPVFEGENPDGLILRAERYFKFYRLNDEEQLEAAVVSLDGDALL